MTTFNNNTFINQKLANWRGAVGASLLAVALGGALLPGTAAAADAKNYTAIGCKVTNRYFDGTVEYGTNGAARNVSLSTTYVTCPITRDSTLEHWSHLTVWFDDRHSTQDARCTLNIIDRVGQVRETRTLRSTGTGIQINTVTRPSPDSGFWATAEPGPMPGQRYSLRCAFPGKESARHFVGTGILGYDFQER